MTASKRIRKPQKRNPERVKIYNQRNHQKHGRKNHLKEKYNITPADWDNIFDNQGHVCAACGSPVPGGDDKWHTDHDHELNIVRGILCQPCNLIAGSNKEHIVRLRLVTKFLEDFYGRR